MKFTQVSALCAIACAALSGQAIAATPTVITGPALTAVNEANTNNRIIFIAGASAVQKGFDSIINNLFSTPPFRFNDTGPASNGTPNYEGVAGPLAKAYGTWPSGANVIVIYRVKGGSANGVFPLARQKAIDALTITTADDICTSGSGSTASPYVCAVGALSRIPDAGISDVAPVFFDQLFNTEGETAETNLKPAELNDLVVAPLYGLAFGLPVTSAVPTTTVFSRSMVASIYSGGVQDWKAVDSSLAADDIIICRRTPGSGTQAVINQYFGNYPCGKTGNFNSPIDRNNATYDAVANPRGWDPVARTFTVDGTNFGNSIVIENSSSGDVKKCLDAASLGHDINDATKPATYTTGDRDGKTVTVSFSGGPFKAIGVLSMDSLSNSVDLADADTTTSPKVLGGTNGLWQFRALDGAGTYTYDPVAKAPKVPTGSGKYPTKESFLSGLWDLQGQESWQYSKSHTSADKVAVINAIRDFAKSPAILQANAALKYVTGALPGTPDPASTGLVMTAKYLGGKMCAPYNHQ